MKNYYEILGVNPKSSFEEIKRVYYQKAKKYHPDSTSIDKEEAKKIFVLIQEAYDCLKDKQKRKEYDDWLYNENHKKKAQNINNVKKNEIKVNFNYFIKNIFKSLLLYILSFISKFINLVLVMVVFMIIVNFGLTSLVNVLTGKNENLSESSENRIISASIKDNNKFRSFYEEYGVQLFDRIDVVKQKYKLDFYYKYSDLDVYKVDVPFYMDWLPNYKLSLFIFRNNKLIGVQYAYDYAVVDDLISKLETIKSYDKIKYRENELEYVWNINNLKFLVYKPVSNKSNFVKVQITHCSVVN